MRVALVMLYFLFAVMAAPLDLETETDVAPTPGLLWRNGNSGHLLTTDGTSLHSDLASRSLGSARRDGLLIRTQPFATKLDAQPVHV